MDVSVMIRPESAPNPKLNNSTWPVAVAAVVGGGSVVNGMGYIRGSKGDYDAWEELGNPGWGWGSMLAYFRKSTTYTPPLPETVSDWDVTWDPSAYGAGPLQVHNSDFKYPDLAAFWAALRHDPGVEVLRDANSGIGPGASWATATIDARDMTRSTARKAYYDTVNTTRPNLHLLTGHTAKELLFGSLGKPLEAKGVRVLSPDGATREYFARKEVILAAGAIQTPQLLQASGIGPASVLRAAGIKVRRHLPAVGANLQDHATTLMLFSLSNQSFPNRDMIASNATYNATVWDEYLANKTGPIAAGPADALIMRSLPELHSSRAAASTAAKLLAQDPKLYLPDLYTSSGPLLKGFKAQRKILARHFRLGDTSIVSMPVPASGISPNALLKPLSRGTVTLNLTDPYGLPVVQYNTLLNPVDADNVLAIVRRNRQFWARPELAHLSPVEIQPGAQHQTDDEIMTALTTNSFALWPSLAHASGTCAMMPEKLGGCVGPDLRVYGVGKLRVVDASMMPIIPAAALQATVYAVGEKAADLIKGRG